MSALANVHEENKTTLVMVHDGFTDTLHSERKGELKLSNNGMFITRDKELAAEMVEKYKGHVDIAPLNTTAKPQGRVMFTMPEMPWKKKKEGEQDVLSNVPEGKQDEQGVSTDGECDRDVVSAVL